MHTNFRETVLENIKPIQYLANLLWSNGIGIKTESSTGIPKVNSSVFHSENETIRGFHLHRISDSNFSNREKGVIKKCFPLIVDEWRLDLLGISDYDESEDRTWNPMISFTIKKNGISVLK